MTLSPEEVALFDAGCRDSGNAAAQELLNVFAVKTSHEVLSHIAKQPRAVGTDLAMHLRVAIEFEMLRRSAKPRR